MFAQKMFEKISIFSSLGIFRHISLFSQLKPKMLNNSKRLELRYSEDLECSGDHSSVHVKLNWMFKFENLKETIAVFIWSTILDHEMIFEISIPSSIISVSNWEILRQMELQPNLPVCLQKKSISHTLGWLLI